MGVIVSDDTICKMLVFNDASEIADMAAMMYDEYNAKIWLNLTNGLEAAPHLDMLNVPYDFCRFRSCSFEQKNWGDAIDSMPDDMLMRLALGQQQVIIDFGANKNCPRALRQGIPIAMRMIANAWDMDVYEHMCIFNRSGQPFQCCDDFTRMVMRLNKHQKSRLKYFKKYVNCNDKGLYINLLCSATNHDGDYDYHVSLAKGSKLA